MAAHLRPTQATYEVHEKIEVDTTDHEDHTFCGILFPIKAKRWLPVEQVVIHSIAVRGQLGPLTVWVSKENTSPQQTLNQPPPPPVEFNADGSTPVEITAAAEDQDPLYNFRLSPKYFTKIYEKTHAPSKRKYDTLDLRENPIILKPGQVRAIYIHSSAPGDEAIVYDNAPTYWNHHQRRVAGRGAAAAAAANAANVENPPRYEDGLIMVGTGKAHLSPRPFSSVPIWGWGNAWRDRREFVGRLQYGVRYKLWNPEQHTLFGRNFHRATISMLACQRNFDSPVSMLPDDCIYYIMNMCRWDWFQDSPLTTMKARHKRIKQKEKQAALLEQQKQYQKRQKKLLLQQQQQEEQNKRAAACDKLKEAEEWSNSLQGVLIRKLEQSAVTAVVATTTATTDDMNNNNNNNTTNNNNINAAQRLLAAGQSSQCGGGLTGENPNNNNNNSSCENYARLGQDENVDDNDDDEEYKDDGSDDDDNDEMSDDADIAMDDDSDVDLEIEEQEEEVDDDDDVEEEEEEEDDDDSESWGRVASDRPFRSRVDVFTYQDTSDLGSDSDRQLSDVENDDDDDDDDDEAHRSTFIQRHGWLRAFLDQHR